MQGDTIIWDWLSGTNKGLKQVTAVVHLLLGNFTGRQEAKKKCIQNCKKLVQAFNFAYYVFGHPYSLYGNHDANSMCGPVG